MGDRPAAERACKEPNPIIDGRKANVNLAILGAKPRGNLQPGKIYYNNRTRRRRRRFITTGRLKLYYVMEKCRYSVLGKKKKLESIYPFGVGTSFMQKQPSLSLCYHYA